VFWSREGDSVGHVVSRAYILSLFRGDCDGAHLVQRGAEQGQKGARCNTCFFCRDRERVSGDRQDSLVPCWRCCAFSSAGVDSLFRNTSHEQQTPRTKKSKTDARFSRLPLLSETLITASNSIDKNSQSSTRVHHYHIAASSPRSTPCTGSSPATNPRRDDIAKP
jgi:hypothetical protein